MNKELMNGMSAIVRDNMWYDCETEEMGLTPDGLQEIITLCADVAIDAASVAFNADGYYESDAFSGGVHGAIKAIEKRMK